MQKRNKIIYWILTLFLSVGMLAGGIQQMLQIGGYNEIITKLHYPLYLLTILGVWKILGVIAILIPKFPLLKEWAYAGFFLPCRSSDFTFGSRTEFYRDNSCSNFIDSNCFVMVFQTRRQKNNNL